MSLRAITWAFAQHETSPTQRLVLLALADHANADDLTWPSIERLTDMTGLSRATVFRALRDLKRDEFIVDAEDRGRDCLRLRLAPDSESQSESAESQSETGESQSETGSTLGTPKEPPRTTPTDVERVWTHYTSKPGKQTRPLPAEERKLIVAALKVATADELCRAIDQCWLSDFHMKRGQYANRDGGKHNSLSKIIKGRQGKETTRERIDWWLAREETTGVAGSGVPSVDPALIARRKQDVQRGHRLKGDPVAVRKAEEAEAWLKRLGIETVREAADGYPTFRDGRGA